MKDTIAMDQRTAPPADDIAEKLGLDKPRNPKSRGLRLLVYVVVALALIFVVGYVLSAIRQRSNSLIPSFIVHTSYNAMLFGVFAMSTFVQKGVR